VVVSFNSGGSFAKTKAYLRNRSKLDFILKILEANGRAGVNALASATPIDSGLAQNSWDYEVSSSGGTFTITWTNSDVENGFPVAIMLQYGYGTGTGGYVQGRDYINPAMRPIFDKIDEQVRKAVTSS
jgi:hypothetical protein